MYQFLSRLFSVPLSLLLILTIHGQTATNSTSFPIVESTEFIKYDEVFNFSNDGEYLLSTGVSASVLDLHTLQLLVSYPDRGSLASSWSIDNRYVAFKDGDGICENAETDYGALVIFYTETEHIERYCVPELTQTSSMEVSPFDSNILRLDHWLLDVSTMTTTPHEMNPELSESLVKSSVGYGQYLWNASTQLPIAKLHYDIEIDNQLHPRGLIIKQNIDACSVECITLVDTLSVDRDIILTSGEIHRNWLLWTGVKSTFNDPVRIILPTEKTDGIIYLTNIQTGETHELTRSSTMGLSDVVAVAATWSPDAQTIAVHFENNTGSRTNVIPDDPHLPVYAEGTLLLHLNWTRNIDLSSDYPADHKNDSD